MVLSRGKSHVVDDGCDMTKDCSIQKTGYGHHDQSKHFLILCICCNIAKPNRGHAGHGEINSCDIHVPSRWSTSHFSSIFCWKYLKLISRFISQNWEPSICNAILQIILTNHIPSNKIKEILNILLCSYQAHANQWQTTRWKQSISISRAKDDSKNRCKDLTTRPSRNSRMTYSLWKLENWSGWLNWLWECWIFQCRNYCWRY